jgi:hypothetical protein
LKKERNSAQSPPLSPASPPNGGHTEKFPAPASADAGKTPASGAPKHSPRSDRGERPNGRRNNTSQNTRLKPNGRDVPAGTPGLAASDDAGGISAENAAIPVAATAPRKASAAVAGSRGSKKRKQPMPEFIPGPDDDVSEMLDATAFVNAVSAHKNLVGVGVGLLRSEDEKIRQRMLERLLEMNFGKGSAPPEEIVEVEVNTPRPKRG